MFLNIKDKVVDKCVLTLEIKSISGHTCALVVLQHCWWVVGLYSIMFLLPGHTHVTSLHDHQDPDQCVFDYIPFQYVVCIGQPTTKPPTSSTIQCPLDIATLDIAAALPIATSTSMELETLALYK